MVQTDVEKHETAANPSTPYGRANTVAQLVPPFVVRTTPPGPKFVNPPTARQTELDGHDTPSSLSMGAGCVVQPEVVAIAVRPPPTAIHDDMEGHDTPSNSLVEAT